MWNKPVLILKSEGSFDDLRKAWVSMEKDPITVGMYALLEQGQIQIFRERVDALKAVQNRQNRFEIQKIESVVILQRLTY